MLQSVPAPCSKSNWPSPWLPSASRRPEPGRPGSAGRELAAVFGLARALREPCATCIGLRLGGQHENSHLRETINTHREHRQSMSRGRVGMVGEIHRETRLPGVRAPTNPRRCDSLEPYDRGAGGLRPRARAAPRSVVRGQEPGGNRSASGGNWNTSPLEQSVSQFENGPRPW